MSNNIILDCMSMGDFTLHSGQKSHYIFDVMKLITNKDFLLEFRKFMKGYDFYVGIEFGGAILVSNYMYSTNYALIRKDGTIYGSPIPDGYVLIDDVVTTENSVRNAIEKIGKYPRKIKCIVDRRHKTRKSLHIESMLEWSEEK